MKLVARHYRTGDVHVFNVTAEGVESAPVNTKRAPLVFGPGWVDLQCNGYGGVDFNHPSTAPEQVCAAVRAMWGNGCTTVLPTIITNSAEEIENRLRVLVRARQLDPDVRRAIPGFHLEGPFISPIDGARGAHPLEHVCPPSIRLWRRWQNAAQGLIRMVTIAPELPRAIPFIRAISNETVVAVGHTLASYSEIRRAADAGARVSTHLGNGCPMLINRHDNPILAQLAEDRLTAAFIPDGIHLPPHVLAVFARAKGNRRTVLVTDAMAAAGAPPGRYTLANTVLEVGRDRVVRQPGMTHFAGSAVTMSEAVGNYSKFTGASLTEAWNAGSVRAAALIGVKSIGTVVAKWENQSLTPVAAIRGKRLLWCQ